jgi:hypothetical protein
MDGSCARVPCIAAAWQLRHACSPQRVSRSTARQLLHRAPRMVHTSHASRDPLHTDCASNRVHRPQLRLLEVHVASCLHLVHCCQRLCLRACAAESHMSSSKRSFARTAACGSCGCCAGGLAGAAICTQVLQGPVPILCRPCALSAVRGYRGAPARPQRRSRLHA